MVGFEHGPECLLERRQGLLHLLPLLRGEGRGVRGPLQEPQGLVQHRDQVGAKGRIVRLARASGSVVRIGQRPWSSRRSRRMAVFSYTAVIQRSWVSLSAASPA